MQGPFSQEMNELLLRQYDIKYLLTKQSGVKGGYPEKVRAARACGAELAVLAPPKESEGVSVEEMCRVLATIQSGADS
jgi:precorrin-6Y C5,15-methyltransferase (decarboxylating)